MVWTSSAWAHFTVHRLHFRRKTRITKQRICFIYEQSSRRRGHDCLALANSINRPCVFFFSPSPSHPFSSVSWELLPLYTAVVKYLKGQSIVLCTRLSGPCGLIFIACLLKTIRPISTPILKLYFNNLLNCFLN